MPSNIMMCKSLHCLLTRCIVLTSLNDNTCLADPALRLKAGAKILHELCCLPQNVLFSFLEKCVLPFHLAKSTVPAISNSRHDNAQANFALFIWLNENVHRRRLGVRHIVSNSSFLGITFNVQLVKIPYSRQGKEWFWL